MIYCLVAFIIERVNEGKDTYVEALHPLGWLFVIFLFMNIFVTTFNLSPKSFVIFLVIGVLIVLVLLLSGVMKVDYQPGDFKFDMGLPSGFYIIVFGMLAVLILLGVITALVNYVQIEKQEIQIHGFFETGMKQYNSNDMTYELDISDVFEYIAARAGSLTLKFKDGKVLKLDTVININQVKKNLDEIRNSVAVKVEKA
jgi:hypothetical protein